MIFVTVGTNEAPFDRLVEGVAKLGVTEHLLVQHGASKARPLGAICIDFLPFEELVAHVRKARVVVTHAGVGSIMVCLANGHRPVVVPRRRRFREAVDDHQVGLARRLADMGLVTLVEDPERLTEALTRVGLVGSGAPAQGGRLADELHAFLTKTLAAGNGRPGAG